MRACVCENKFVSLRQKYYIMKQIEITTRMQCCAWDELSEAQQTLVRIAKEQTERAYCPYSEFHVGAALELKDGTIVRGCNQENAAYPSGLCAERSALFAAGAQYPEQPVMRLAIACYTKGHFTRQPGSPCGACRQVMVETEDRYQQPIEVILYGEEETYVFESACDLLPLYFVSENLNG